MIKQIWLGQRGVVQTFPEIVGAQDIANETQEIRKLLNEGAEEKRTR